MKSDAVERRIRNVNSNFLDGTLVLRFRSLAVFAVLRVIAAIKCVGLTGRTGLVGRPEELNTLGLCRNGTKSVENSPMDAYTSLAARNAQVRIATIAAFPMLGKPCEGRITVEEIRAANGSLQGSQIERDGAGNDRGLER